MAAAALVVGHRCRRRCTYVNHAKTQQVHRDNTEYLGKKGRGKRVKDTEREKRGSTRKVLSLALFWRGALVMDSKSRL